MCSEPLNLAFRVKPRQMYISTSYFKFCRKLLVIICHFYSVLERGVKQFVEFFRALSMQIYILMPEALKLMCLVQSNMYIYLYIHIYNIYYYIWDIYSRGRLRRRRIGGLNEMTKHSVKFWTVPGELDILTLGSLC